MADSFACKRRRLALRSPRGRRRGRWSAGWRKPSCRGRALRHAAPSGAPSRRFPCGVGPRFREPRGLPVRPRPRFALCLRSVRRKPAGPSGHRQPAPGRRPSVPPGGAPTPPECAACEATPAGAAPVKARNCRAPTAGVFGLISAQTPACSAIKTPLDGAPPASRVPGKISAVWRPCVSFFRVRGGTATAPFWYPRPAPAGVTRPWRAT